MKLETQPNNRAAFWVLSVAYLSFFALGLPDGALTVAFIGMSEELGLLVAHSGYIVAANSIMYSLTSACLGRLNRCLKLESINLLGTVLLGVGFLGIGFAQNLAMLIVSTAFCGTGVGMIDSSLNTYMARSFSARHMNFLHCFWGAGSTFSPFLMSQMVLLFGWRAGYFTLVGIMGMVSTILLVSVCRGVWERGATAPAQTEQAATTTQHLSKRWHKAAQALTCFFYGGVEYSLVFFTAIVLAARGMPLETIALYPMAYYFSIAAGRVVFGWVSKWLRDITVIRIGLALGFAGAATLLFTGNIAGIALAGFGFAPVFPSLLHNTAQRFAPNTLAKLVGYQVAALGAGSAVLVFGMSQLLGRVSLGALYPMSMALIALVFGLNEALEWAARRKVA